MSLLLQWDTRGRALRSNWWYGRFEIGGKPRCKNLGVPVKGQWPNSGLLRDQGDAAFEASRNTALRVLETWKEEIRRNRGREDLLQEIHEVRFGAQVKSAPITDLVSAWEALHRPAPLSEQHRLQEVSKLTKFVTFLGERFPTVKEMVQVRPAMAESYMSAVKLTGKSAKTFNDTLVSLRGAFQNLRERAGLAENPFDNIPKESVTSIRREPFSPEDLARIVPAATTDKFIGPIVLTALSTAMRRGDCCNLRWVDVDMVQNLVSVVPSKSKHTDEPERVAIPIFPLLRGVLEAQKAAKQTTAYVFPEQRKMYLTNPDGITWRFEKFIEKLGFAGTAGGEDVGKSGDPQRLGLDGETWLCEFRTANLTVKTRVWSPEEGDWIRLIEAVQGAAALVPRKSLEQF